MTGRFLLGRVSAAAGLLLFAATLLAPAPAAASRLGGAPSAAQRLRIQHFDKYIDYFSSLSYGLGKPRVSANYIRALITAESSVNPRARSHKGARGLSQIMPETGRIAARSLYEMRRDFDFVDEARLARLDPNDLYDPAINLLIACYLTSNYLERFHGRTDLVVSAWNAGPEAVTRYRNNPPPYRETHGLIARVRGYLRHYEGGVVPSWQLAAWELPVSTGRGWDLEPTLPSRSFIADARRAAQRASVPTSRRRDASAPAAPFAAAPAENIADTVPNDATAAEN